MNMQFTDRIAVFNTVAAALASLLVFFAIYYVVSITAYNHLDSDISREADEVRGTIWIAGNKVLIDSLSEWDEREHQQLEANPTFLQVSDKAGRVQFHSANMPGSYLPVDTLLTQRKFFNANISHQAIRVGQFPIRNNAKTITGYLNIGVSRQESAVVLKNLRTILVVAFPFLLIVLFLATTFAASQSIAPVNQLINAVGEIDNATMDRRLPLPPHKDEIFLLTTTINELLSRIESGLLREKQFTSDVSHELRTPLAAIRGTLEVLVRKPREIPHYEEKIGQVIRETDRMHLILDQLLQLARFQSPAFAVKTEIFDLNVFFHAVSEKWKAPLARKKMKLLPEIQEGSVVCTDKALLEIILGNLIGNAAKYGREGGVIISRWEPSEFCLVVSDDGPGIPESHLPNIFQPFYRTDESRGTGAEGAGLGLAIVKKLTELLAIRIAVESQPGLGTSFFLYFPPSF